MIAVQPINGAADVKSHALAQNGQNDSQSIVFSDSYSKPKSNQQSSDGPPSNAAKPLVEKSHSRGVSKTDQVPSNEDHDSNITANKSITDIKSDTNVELSLSNQTGSAKSKQETKVVQPAVIDEQSSDSKPKTASVASSTSTTTTTMATSTSTTTTTTTPKPTTTTPAPKKPLITQSVEDIPGLLSKAAEAHPQLINPLPDDGGSNEPHSLQSSEKITFRDYQLPNHNWLMSIIGIIVVIPLIVVVSNCAVRKVRDIWSKRRYRRMDYLIEDMYN